MENRNLSTATSSSPTPEFPGWKNGPVSSFPGGHFRSWKKGSLVYASPLMQHLLDRVAEAAGLPYSVLITGETGTGKELIARILHEQNSSAPLLAVNCPSVPATLWESELFGHVRGAFTDAKTTRRGYLEEVGSGTLFFDEIGEIPLEIQAKLLRLLQERIYRKVGGDKSQKAYCRFVFATNRDLEGMIRRGEFRADLYYRINVFHLVLPPLRERIEDILPLFIHFLEKYRLEFGLDTFTLEPELQDSLICYSWPGNVRELENVCLRVLARCTNLSGGQRKHCLGRDHLPEDFQRKLQGVLLPEICSPPVRTEEREERYTELMERYSRTLIRDALSKARGNKTRAAELLGLKRTTFNYKLRELQKYG